MNNLNQFVSTQAKPLPVFLLLDVSGSMSGEKIATLNNAVDEMINNFKSESLTEIDLQVCVITFGGQARIHTELTSVKSIVYHPMTASGMTPMGAALTICSGIIDDKTKVSSKGYRPTVLLVSDGQPNDTWEQPLQDFINGKRTGKCERWAIGIGQDVDNAMLKKFINDDKRPVFDVTSANEISKYFRFVTMSTIARSKSINPNESIDLDAEIKKFEEKNDSFKFFNK